MQAGVVLLAVWLGAALITAAVFAPAAFAVLPSRSLAGDLVGRVLPTLFVAGIVVLVASAILAGFGRTPGRARGASISAFAGALACAVAQFGITPRLDGIRAGIGGPVDALPLDDARRVAFGVYHGYNVAGLGVGMVGAAACLVLLVLAMRPRH
jgi:hypothetical protein